MALTVEDKDWISSRLVALLGPINTRLDVLERRLDFLATFYHNIDERLPALNKSVFDFGTLAGRFSRDQMQATGRDHDLANRVARLEEQMSKLNPAA